MSLGLGGRGDDLAKSCDVKWAGWETVAELKAAKLEVASCKPPHLKKMFDSALLWIDPEKDIALKQQFFDTSGYRLTRYHNIKVGDQLSDKVFVLKPNSNPDIMHLRAD